MHSSITAVVVVIWVYLKRVSAGRCSQGHVSPLPATWLTRASGGSGSTIITAAGLQQQIQMSPWRLEAELWRLTREWWRLMLMLTYWQTRGGSCCTIWLLSAGNGLANVCVTLDNSGPHGSHLTRRGADQLSINPKQLGPGIVDSR